MKYNKISVIIPAYNEERTIKEVIEEVIKFDSLDLEKEIIVVNDGSKDSTAKIVEEFGDQIILLNNEKNSGKTKSVKNGIDKATGELIVFQDADLELVPKDLTKFIRIFLEHDTDVVFGNRFNNGQSHVYGMYFFGNKIMTFFSNIFFFPRMGILVKDMTCGYKMIKASHLKQIAKHLEQTSRFGIEATLTARLSRLKKVGNNGKTYRLNFDQVDIDYIPRTRGEGKHLKAFGDGWKMLKDIFKHNIL